MKNIRINGTKDTFNVLCDAENGLIQFEGASYPEDAVSFFEPIYDWLSSYIENVNKPITLDFKINYLNTSTTKCLLDFFEALEDYNQDGGEILVNWYFDKLDKDIMETGEEFNEEMDIPFNLISY